MPQRRLEIGVSPFDVKLAHSTIQELFFKNVPSSHSSFVGQMLWIIQWNSLCLTAGGCQTQSAKSCHLVT